MLPNKNKFNIYSKKLYKRPFILVFMLILSNVLGNMNEETHFSKENTSRDLPRSLQADNYIVVNYASEFSSAEEVVFKNQNDEIGISEIYLNDTKLTNISYVLVTQVQY